MFGVKFTNFCDVLVVVYCEQPGDIATLYCMGCDVFTPDGTATGLHVTIAVLDLILASGILMLVGEVILNAVANRTVAGVG